MIKKTVVLNQAGFSVLEMVAVIAIIGLTLVGLVSLALQSVQVQRLNKNNLTAAMLAQEGIEIIRNKRDSNWKSRTLTWDQVMYPGNYRVDYNDSYSIPFDNVADITDPGTKLYINGSGMYDHDNTGAPTNFNRMITINHLAGDASSTITAQVRYRNGENYFNYIAETVLYDWN